MNTGAQVSFTAGSDNGAPTSNFQYSIDGSSWVSLAPADATSPVTVTGLSNGVRYGIRLRALNAFGASAGSTTVFVIPAPQRPSAPTRPVASPRNAAASVAFLPGSGNGSRILNYQYSINGGIWRSLSPADVTSPVTVPGLANGVLYRIRVRAVNSIGAGSASVAVAVRPSSRPVTPGPPTFLIGKPGPTGTTAAVSFWPGSDGGSKVSNYQYSINLGGWKAVSPADTTTPVAISGLAAGQTYSVRLRAVNSAGAGTASSNITMLNIAAAPTAVTSTGSDRSVSVTFTPPASGGATILNYHYSLNGGPWIAFSPARTTSPLTITGLTNKTSYGLRLRAVTKIGAGNPTPTIGITPGTVGTPPTSLTATPLNASASIGFTPGTSAGLDITGYEFSFDGGVVWYPVLAGSNTSPVTVGVLINGTSYKIRLRARMGAEMSPASSAVAVTPRTVPGAPTSLRSTPLDTAIRVSFTQESNGGAPVLNYEYRIVAGSTTGPWTSLSPADSSSPITITGLRNNVSYRVYLRAVNAAGSGLAGMVSAQAYPPPSTPTGLTATAGNGSASIAFSASGTAITAIQYSLNNGAWKTALENTDPAMPIEDLTSPILIRGLSNGTLYSVRLRALNAAGASAPSVSVPVQPHA